jgi:Protein of unknown function (DUF3160)
MCRRFLLGLPILVAACACSDVDSGSSNDSDSTAPAVPPTRIELAHPSPYGGELDYDPLTPMSSSLLETSSLALDEQEKRVLQRNSFVISDRYRFPNFLMAYAEVYRNDLPVYVSADSILHALHKSYDAMLQAAESKILSHVLRNVISGMRTHLRRQPVPRQAAADIDLYLTVALSLVEGEPARPVAGADPTQVRDMVQRVMAQGGISNIEIFGVQRLVDFSQFQPRGHYTHGENLKRYFRAVMWLSRIDFRLLDTACDGSRIVRRRQISALRLLASLATHDIREQWNAFDKAISAFVSAPDQLDLHQVDDVLKRLSQVRTDEAMERALVESPLGQQRIMGHPLYKCVRSTESLPPPVGFALFPQRYTPESHVLTEVTFDRIPMKRGLPNPLDVAFAVFGNNQAGELLGPELRKWRYEAPLLHARSAIAQRRTDGFYQGWLDAIRSLSHNHEAELEGLPRVARTEAWGRRLLNTQLASWAELRRDTILYAKPSYGTIMCKYPDAYVDPYPNFFDRMAELAERGLALSKVLGQLLPTVELEQHWHLPERMQEHFRFFAETVTTLGEMARLEREGEPLAPEHLAFVNRAVSASTICGGFVIDGWYARLFFDPDEATEFKPTIADIHTDPETGVLHVGTGAPRLMTVAVRSGSSVGLYLGPVSSYFETITPPGERLNDERWAESIAETQAADVDWMRDLVARAPDGRRASSTDSDWRSVMRLDPVLAPLVRKSNPRPPPTQVPDSD